MYVSKVPTVSLVETSEDNVSSVVASGDFTRTGAPIIVDQYVSFLTLYGDAIEMT